MKTDIEYKALSDLCAKLDDMRGRSDEITEKALYAGAGIIADKVRSNLESVLSGDSTGELLESFGISKMKTEKSSKNVSIGFDGYDSRNVPNNLKARALESGTSKQQKKPFMRPAVNAVRAQALNAMHEVIAEEVKKSI